MKSMGAHSYRVHSRSSILSFKNTESAQQFSSVPQYSQYHFPDGKELNTSCLHNCFMLIPKTLIEEKEKEKKASLWTENFIRNYRLCQDPICTTLFDSV